MVKDVFTHNDIAYDDFSQAVRTALEAGRGKYRNVFIKGPANCGKTFLLIPLNMMFKTFTNPLTATCAGLGLKVQR